MIEELHVLIFNEHNYFYKKPFKKYKNKWLNARLRENYPIRVVSASSKHLTRRKKLIKKRRKINIIKNNIKFEKEYEFEDIEMIQDIDEPILKEHNYCYTKILNEKSNELLNTRLLNELDSDGKNSVSSANNRTSPLSAKQSTQLIENSKQITETKNNINAEESEYEDIEILEDEDENNMQEDLELLPTSNSVLPVTTALTTHPYTINDIKTDKSTINDFLEFKNSSSTRSGDNINLQIKTPKLNEIKKPKFVMVSLKNNIIARNNSTVPAFTATSYGSILSPATASTTILSEQKSHETLTTGKISCSSLTATSSPTCDNNVEKINFYRRKQAELIYKEKQLKLQHTKIQLAKAKEVLNHMKELNDCEIE